MGKIYKFHLNGDDNSFTRVSNLAIDNKTLSMKERGIYSTLSRYSNGYRVTIDMLVAGCGDGRASIEKGINGLIEKGLVVRELVRVDNNSRIDYIYRLRSFEDKSKGAKKSYEI